MHKNNNGFTLVELIIAVALLTGVLATIYYFFSVSMHSYNYVQVHYTAELEARKVVRSMAEDIRKANGASSAGIAHPAVEVIDGGMRLNIYTDIDGDGVMELVIYKIENNQLKYGNAELGSSPTSWKVLADNVINKTETPAVAAFIISGKQINIRLDIGNSNNSLKEGPVSIKTSISVRSKGAMN